MHFFFILSCSASLRAFLFCDVGNLKWGKSPSSSPRSIIYCCPHCCKSLPPVHVSATSYYCCISLHCIQKKWKVVEENQCFTSHLIIHRIYSLACMNYASHLMLNRRQFRLFLPLLWSPRHTEKNFQVGAEHIYLAQKLSNASSVSNSRTIDLLNFQARIVDIVNGVKPRLSLYKCELSRFLLFQMHIF